MFSDFIEIFHFIDSCNVNCGVNYLPSVNIPTAFAFYNDTVFIGVRRRATAVYSTLNYFKLCDIVDKKCPKLRPYPSFELTEFLTEECSSPDQVISVERFSVDRCVHEPKLWIFDTKGIVYKKTPYSIGDPALKVYSLKDNTLLRRRSVPSSLYDRNNLGIVQVIVYVVDQEDSCKDTYAYLIDSTRGSLIVYSWKEDRFWRFDSPKFYGDAKHSDFTVTTLSGKQVTYFPPTHIHEATVDLCYNQILYHARGSLSAYAIDLQTVNNVSTSIVGPTKFGVTYVGEKNKRGQTGSQAINNDLCTVWGIQEQNYAITCYNRRRPLTPGAVRIVVADRERLPFLVDMKLEPEPKHCVYEKGTSRYFETYKHASFDYSHHYSKNWIFVLTNNEKDIENGEIDETVENFGIYYVKEDDALKVHPQCLPYYKEEYQPPSYNRKPYMPPKVQKLVYEEPVQEQNVKYEEEDIKDPVVPYEKLVDSYEDSKRFYLPQKEYQTPPPRIPFKGRYNEKLAAYEVHREQHQPDYYNAKYDPYYYNYGSPALYNRYKKSDEEPEEISYHGDDLEPRETDENNVNYQYN